MALIDKASLLMVPSTYEAGKLYNVLPSGNRAPDNKGGAGYDQTRADFDFDRGTDHAATRVNADGLIEKYRENLLLQSNQFDTTWGKVNISATSGQEGYDGKNNAWKIEGTGSAAFSYLLQSESNNIVKTRSVYAKAGSVSYLGIWGSGSNFGYFDLSNGTLDNMSGSSAIAHSITDVGNGWYRCEFVSTGSSSSFYIVPSLTANGTSLSTGQNIYIQNAQLESGLVATDVLTSGATTAKAGVLVDLPRINYDANGENGNLLLEPSRQNKFLFSEYYGSGALGIYATGTNTHSVTNNYSISPEGVKNAIRFVADITSVGDRVVLRDGVSCGGGNHTLTFYAKSNTSNTYTMKMHFDGGGKKQIEVTPEWQRFEYGQSANTTCNAGIECSSASGYSSSVDVSVYGFQLEPQLYSTSYIPTMGTTETRAADSCSVTGVSDVIGQTEGTIFVDLDLVNPTSVNGNYHILIVGSTSQRITIYSNASLIIVDGLGGGGFTAITTPFSAGRKKIAVAYASNDIAFYMNGVLIGTKTTASIPTSMGQIDLGGNYTFNNFIAGNEFNQTALFKERLSNAELATLTTL